MQSARVRSAETVEPTTAASCSIPKMLDSQVHSKQLRNKFYRFMVAGIAFLGRPHREMAWNNALALPVLTYGSTSENLQRGKIKVLEIWRCWSLRCRCPEMVSVPGKNGDKPVEPCDPGYMFAILRFRSSNRIIGFSGAIVIITTILTNHLHHNTLFMVDKHI